MTASLLAATLAAAPADHGPVTGLTSRGELLPDDDDVFLVSVVSVDVLLLPLAAVPGAAGVSEAPHGPSTLVLWFEACTVDLQQYTTCFSLSCQLAFR